MADIKLIVKGASGTRRINISRKSATEIVNWLNDAVDATEGADQAGKLALEFFDELRSSDAEVTMQKAEF